MKKGLCSRCRARDAEWGEKRGRRWLLPPPFPDLRRGEGRCGCCCCCRARTWEEGGSGVVAAAVAVHRLEKRRRCCCCCCCRAQTQEEEGKVLLLLLLPCPDLRIEGEKAGRWWCCYCCCYHRRAQTWEEGRGVAAAAGPGLEKRGRVLLLLCLDLRRGGEERENLFDCCRWSVWAREGEDVFGESEIVNVQVESEFKNIVWRETLDSWNFESLPRFDFISFPHLRSHLCFYPTSQCKVSYCWYTIN